MPTGASEEVPFKTLAFLDDACDDTITVTVSVSEVGIIREMLDGSSFLETDSSDVVMFHEGRDVEILPSVTFSEYSVDILARIIAGSETDIFPAAPKGDGKVSGSDTFIVTDERPVPTIDSVKTLPSALVTVVDADSLEGIFGPSETDILPALGDSEN